MRSPYLLFFGTLFVFTPYPAKAEQYVQNSWYYNQPGIIEMIEQPYDHFLETMSYIAGAPHNGRALEADGKGRMEPLSAFERSYKYSGKPAKLSGSSRDISYTPLPAYHTDTEEARTRSTSPRIMLQSSSQ